MNLSLLKKIGLDIAEGAAFFGKALITAEGYGPILNAILPPSVSSKITAVENAIDPKLKIVDDIIATVEGVGQLGGMTGAQKLDAAAGLAVTAFSDSMSLVGHDVQDQALLDQAKNEFTQAVKLLVQSRVDFLNSLKAKS